jgi:hypothetical protein
MEVSGSGRPKNIWILWTPIFYLALLGGATLRDILLKSTPASSCQVSRLNIGNPQVGADGDSSFHRQPEKKLV